MRRLRGGRETLHGARGASRVRTVPVDTVCVCVRVRVRGGRLARCRQRRERDAEQMDPEMVAYLEADLSAVAHEVHAHPYLSTHRVRHAVER